MSDYDPDDAFRLPDSVLSLRDFTKIMKQELIQNPERLLSFNQQIQSDLQSILTCLESNHLGEPPLADFVAENFSKDLRVTIMGYSLGGLCALQSYLLRPNSFSACVLLNSGASFQDMDGSSMFGHDGWKELQRRLLSVTRSQSSQVNANYFSHVILGHAKIELHDLLADNCHKILVLLGGTDRIINYRSMANLEPHETGLAIFQIPGLEHHINIKTIAGQEWHAWSDFAVQMILSFEENHPTKPSPPRLTEEEELLEQ